MSRNASATKPSSVGAHEAKTNLGQLLDRVEQGEVIVISRHGEPIARLAPFREEANPSMVTDCVAKLDSIAEGIRARGKSLSQAEIRAAIDEGRK